MDLQILNELAKNIADSWAQFNILLALGIAIAYFIVDSLYAYYTLAITNLKPASAATTGAIMHFLLALGVLSYVHNYLYIFPIAIGSWIGTYFVIKRAKKNHSNIPSHPKPQSL